MSFWPFKRRSKPTPGHSHTLADVARGMQHAVNSTQELLERHYAQVLSRYFKEDGTADTKQFILPDKSRIDVPTIALIPASALVLKEMLVRMSVRVDCAQVKTADVEDPSDPLTRSSFQVSFAPGSDSRESNVFNITMKFVGGDPPEGVARIMECYTNSVIARKPALDSEA